MHRCPQRHSIVRGVVVDLRFLFAPEEFRGECSEIPHLKIEMWGTPVLGGGRVLGGAVVLRDLREPPGGFRGESSTALSITRFGGE